MYEKLRQFKLIDGLLVLGVGLMAIGIGLNLKNGQSNKPSVEIIKAKVTPTIGVVKTDVIFEMAGEVVKPGVYKLVKGSRIADAFIVSGGLAVNADRDWVEKNINKAEIISDGMKVYIPRQQPAGAGSYNGQANIVYEKSVLGVQKSNIVNINTAGVEELDKLDGVGPAIAGRIIDYRNQNGGFKDINELKLVSGIGDKMFEKIKDKVGI